MRESLLRKKEKEMRRRIEGWAERQGLLKHGERIRVTIEIEEIPEGLAGEYLTMPPEEFFSHQRLIDAGASPAFATRIKGTIQWHLDEEMRKGSPILTMQTFVERYGSTTTLLGLPYLGKGSVRIIIQMLRAANFSVRGTDVQ